MDPPFILGNKMLQVQVIVRELLSHSSIDPAHNSHSYSRDFYATSADDLCFPN